MTQAPTERKRPGNRPDDELVVTYRAAQAFLVAEWLGALMMVASFTQLYIFVLGPYGVSTQAAVGSGAFILVAGGAIYWRSRSIYLGLDFPWKRKWEYAATVFAVAGLLFWFLFLVAAFLVWRGVELL